MLFFAEVGFEPAKPLDFEAAVDGLMDHLPTAGEQLPSLSGPGASPAWSARFCVDADTVKAAASAALLGLSRAVHDGLPGVRIRTRYVEVLDEPEFDRRLAEPAVPALVGIAEIAEHLAVSKARARELVALGRIRKVADLASGPVCLARDLETYAATPRRAGRPRKAVESVSEPHHAG